MEMTVKRRVFTAYSTIGDFAIEGLVQCNTLEDMVRPGPKVHGLTAIPEGRYQVVLTWSNRFGRVLPELLGVPAFTAIRIHPGNEARNTEGCILVGDYDPSKPDWVSNSRHAFDRLYPQIELAVKTSKVWISVSK